MTTGEEQVRDAAQGARAAAEAANGVGAKGAQEAQEAQEAPALKSTTENSYEELAADELAGRVASCKKRGFRFIQMCATTEESGVELLYSFSDPDPHVRDISAFVLHVEDGARVPSISGDYPEAFVNENEAHDLFGVCFDGLALDYEGKFYTVPVAYPMNPRAAQAASPADGTAKEQGEPGEADSPSAPAGAGAAAGAADAGADTDEAREEARR